MLRTHYDAAIIGGGFFGCCIALHLKERFKAVVVIEQERDLCSRASFVNQARIHNGYHYPRSVHTAYRSRVNFEQFVRDFPDCVVSSFVSLYCISRRQSQVSAQQFERFCRLIGAPLRPARAAHVKLFDSRLVHSVYEVTEYAFDGAILRDTLRRKLLDADVEVVLATRVEAVDGCGVRSCLRLADGSAFEADAVFNCTYAGLRHVAGLAPQVAATLKQEITEIVLIEPPDEIRSVGITVMDGPFFSTMPFPARALHSLSHVRYTPHASWLDAGSGAPQPYAALARYSRTSRARFMLNDARRYVPALSRARPVESLFEVKTVLVRSELDDSRPILVERGGSTNPTYSIMGGKIDNVYDVIHHLRCEGL